ncbi:MAG: T9SS type A sorting domain-containing protein [Bacteroidetes bacterium]|nr:T9SS type A sorting domain-containing protein [Bacteroidota bacterium]
MKTNFKHLNRAIYAMSTGKDKSIVIDNCEFIKNLRGIYLSATNYGNITRNEIRFFDHQPDESVNLTAMYGLYLDHCTGYHVEANHFYQHSPKLLPPKYGLVISNSGSDNNVIYNNTFDTLNYAAVAQGCNRDNGTNGLCFKCNDFSTNDNDITVSDDGGPLPQGIATYQGANIPNDNTAPAGNTFVRALSYNIVDEITGDSIYYYHHSNTGIYPRLIPILRTSNVFPFSVQGTNYTKSESCPSYLINLSKTAERLAYQRAEGSADSIKQTLLLRIDGGSTTAISSEIITSSPDQSEQLRENLMSLSPFLSNTVLISSIQKENVLPNAMIRDILVSNPQSAKSGTVLNELDYRSVPMPDYMFDQILDGQYISGAQENMKAKQHHYNNAAYLPWSNLYRIFNNDTVNASSSDSLDNLLTTSNFLGSKYQLSLRKLFQGDTILAFQIFDQIPAIFTLNEHQLTEHGYYQEYSSVLSRLLHQDSVYSLPDSSQQELLFYLLDHSTDLPGVYSRNLLIHNGLLQYEEPITINHISKSKRNRNRMPVQSDGSNFLKVFPNPAKDYVVAEIHIPGIINNPYLSVFDMSGRTLKTIPLSNPDDQIVISLKGLSQGVYILTLTNQKVISRSLLNVLSK